MQSLMVKRPCTYVGDREGVEYLNSLIFQLGTEMLRSVGVVSIMQVCLDDRSAAEGSAATGCSVLRIVRG
jgi:hypothetical protein